MCFLSPSCTTLVGPRFVPRTRSIWVVFLVVLAPCWCGAAPGSLARSGDRGLAVHRGRRRVVGACVAQDARGLVVGVVGADGGLVGPQSGDLGLVVLEA